MAFLDVMTSSFSSRSFEVSVFFLAKLIFEMLLIPVNSSFICCTFSCLFDLFLSLLTRSLSFWSIVLLS